MPSKINYGQKNAVVVFAASTSGDPTALQLNGLNFLQTTAYPSSSGGCSSHRVKALASTNATVIRASAGQVYGVEAHNRAAYPVYLKFFNKATAPVVGTDAPVWVIAIPAGGRVEISRPMGRAFSAGISYAVTLGVADTDTAAIAVDDIVASVDYA